MSNCNWLQMAKCIFEISRSILRLPGGLGTPLRNSTPDKQTKKWVIRKN